MKTLKNSKIVLLFLLIGITVGCKKEDQIKTTITPTSVVYEDTSLNSYVQIDSTTLIGAYGCYRKDTSFIFSVGDYISEASLKKGSMQYTNLEKIFQIEFFGQRKNQKSNEDTTIKICFLCKYSDTNSLANFKKYEPLISDYATVYHSSRMDFFSDFFGDFPIYSSEETASLSFNVNWGEGDQFYKGERYQDIYPNVNYFGSTIRNVRLVDGKLHLVLEINRKLNDFYTFSQRTGKCNTATFKARIVLN
jgi:hypothetical protein